MKFVSQAEVVKMVGKQCTAMGTCGMTKDVEVTGILLNRTIANEPIIQEKNGRLCSVNKNTLKLLDLYTVWVGGTEVNDFYLSKDKADTLAQEYIDDNYDDVIIEKIN